MDVFVLMKMVALEIKMEIRQTIYSIIENIGKEKIKEEVTSNTKLSQKYIDIIMKEGTTKLASELRTDEIIATLAEVLLHFMLTTCTLPSERKVRIKNDLYVDIVIPNLQRLRRNPEKSLIVQIIKSNDDINKISQLEFLQPNHENIWLISNRLFSTDCIIYSIFPIIGLRNYSDIIIYLDDFLRVQAIKVSDLYINIVIKKFLLIFSLSV